MSGRAGSAVAVPLLIALLLIAGLTAAGCGPSGPEETVYRFLGSVQARDFSTMRGCISPDAIREVERKEGELSYWWEELLRRYEARPLSWRMEFRHVGLECSYLDSGRALVKLARGRCILYGLRDDRWEREGEIDFSNDDFSPLYVVLKEGDWYLEALDLYIVYGLESLARIGD